MRIKNWFYYLILFLPITIISCEDKNLVSELPAPFDTEVDCPAIHYKIILAESTPADIRQAIDAAIKVKNEFHTTEKYSVLKLRSKKSFFIKDVSPEQLQYCYLTAIPIPNIKP